MRLARPSLAGSAKCSSSLLSISFSISNSIGPLVAGYAIEGLGYARAFEWRCSGRKLGAAEALEWGLVNRVVEADRVVNEAVEFGRRITEKPSRTLKIGKEAFYRQLELGLEEAYAYASQVMTTNMLARDAQEGIDAFIAKRAPVWRGE